MLLLPYCVHPAKIDKLYSAKKRVLLLILDKVLVSIYLLYLVHIIKIKIAWCTSSHILISFNQTIKILN